MIVSHYKSTDQRGPGLTGSLIAKLSHHDNRGGSAFEAAGCGLEAGGSRLQVGGSVPEAGGSGTPRDPLTLTTGRMQRSLGFKRPKL